jgi:carboxyl-terminal processing protease
VSSRVRGEILTPRAWRAAAGLIALLLGGCASAAAQLASPIPFPEDPARQQLRVLDQVRRVFEDEFLYPEAFDGESAAGLAGLEQRVRGGLTAAEFETGLREVIASLPAGTASYVSRQERIGQALGATAAYEGIGAFIGFREGPVPRFVLLSVVEGSPAAVAGLQAHDSILAIDGGPVDADEGLAAAERIRGPEGTRVRLEVSSPDGTRRVVDVERRRLVPQAPIRARVMSTGSVHLEVPVFADAALIDAIGAAMQALAEEPDSDGLVIDLRIAGGSGAWPLEDMLSLFLQGRQGEFVGRDHRGPLEITGRDLMGTQAVPLVVLVGPDTNGPPEIFAAAVQASSRAALVGTETRGRVYDYGRKILIDGSLLSYARSTYRTRRGQDLGASGVRPDILVDAEWDQVTESFDPALGVALELLERLTGG